MSSISKPESDGDSAAAGASRMPPSTPVGLGGRRSRTAVGQSQLVRLELPAEDSKKELAQLIPMTAAKDGSQYAHPAWDPPGQRLAVSVWKPGGFRDIHIFDTAGNHLRALTWDRASDTDRFGLPMESI